MATKKKTGPNPNPAIDVHTTKDARGDHRFTIDDQDGFTYAYPPRSFDSEATARDAGNFVMDYRALRLRAELEAQAKITAERNQATVDELNDRLAAQIGKTDELTQKLADVKPPRSFWTKALIFLLGAAAGIGVWHWLI